MVANFGFDKASASDAIERGKADLVSFGKPFIGNPDLVRRLREDLPLSESTPETYYQGGPQGYVDYPSAGGSIPSEDDNDQSHARHRGVIGHRQSRCHPACRPNGGWYHATKLVLEGLRSSLRQELAPFGLNVVIRRAGAIDTSWRAIVGASLLEHSGDVPYSKAVRVAHSKFMGPEFGKMVADPAVIADVVQKIVTTDRPHPIYTAPRMARPSEKGGFRLDALGPKIAPRTRHVLGIESLEHLLG